MKKLALALALGLSSSGAMAGGIQIDPTGTGNIGASKFIDVFATEFGAVLFDDVLFPSQTGTIWGHNRFLTGALGLPGEITFTFELPVTSAITGNSNTVGSSLSLSQSAAQAAASVFNLYYDSVADATLSSGAGYNDGILLASGTATIVGGSAGVVNLSGDVAAHPGAPVDAIDGLADGLADLAPNNNTPTISSTGSLQLLIDFTFKNPLWVVNDLAGMAIDMTTLNGLATPLAAPPAGNVPASTSFDGGAVSASFGADAENDFNCLGDINDSEVAGVPIPACDFQASLNTTPTVAAVRVPEPGTLALAGLSLLGLGGAARRKSKKA